MNKSLNIFFVLLLMMAALNLLMLIIGKDQTKAEHYFTRFNIYLAAMWVILANS